jgi:hypothetical protein
MGKSHVSEAITNLEVSGWLLQDENGNFQFPPPPSKVPRSGTQKFRNREPQVPDSETEVPRTGTEVPEIGTHLNIEEQRKNNEQQRIDQNHQNRWILKAVEAFHDIDPRIVEIGVLQTLMQRTNAAPIKSVQYFKPQIDDTATNGPSKTGIEAMLHTRREQYRRQLNKEQE